MFVTASKFLGFLLKQIYYWTENYIMAITLFTLLTKIILFPVSLWTHRNSLAMVHLMPELNRLKIKFYGDKDAIAEETQLLYKREGYHPLLGTVPMFIHLGLLIGVIGAVRELLGAGELFGFALMPDSFVPIRIFGQAPGAFFVLAALVALQNYIKNVRKKAGKSYEKIGSGCSEDCMNCSEKGCTRRF